MLIFNRAKRKRENAIAAALPEAVEILAMVMQAGLDLQMALAIYLEKAPQGPLPEELARLQADLRMGLSRVDALKALARRSPQVHLTDTARSLAQGLELGTPLTPILKAQARLLRTQRAFAAEKQAAVAPLKLMFPLIVFIFPTLFAILMTPILMQAKASGGLVP